MLLLCMPIWCVAAGYTPYSGTCELPYAQMSSTSAYLSAVSNMQRNSQTQYAYGGFQTSASAITGGVTTYDMEEALPMNGGARRYSPGVPGFPTPIDFDWTVVLVLMALSYWYIRKRYSTKKE